MATNAQNATVTPSSNSREWNIFAYQAFARIAARKHGLAVPALDFDEIPDSDLEVRVRLVSELAHLPPA